MHGNSGDCCSWAKHMQEDWQSVLSRQGKQLLKGRIWQEQLPMFSSLRCLLWVFLTNKHMSSVRILLHIRRPRGWGNKPSAEPDIPIQTARVDLRPHMPIVVKQLLRSKHCRPGPRPIAYRLLLSCSHVLQAIIPTQQSRAHLTSLKLALSQRSGCDFLPTIGSFLLAVELFLLTIIFGSLLLTIRACYL